MECVESRENRTATIQRGGLLQARGPYVINQSSYPSGNKRYGMQVHQCKLGRCSVVRTPRTPQRASVPAAEPEWGMYRLVLTNEGCSSYVLSISIKHSGGGRVSRSFTVFALPLSGVSLVSCTVGVRHGMCVPSDIPGRSVPIPRSLCDHRFSVL